MSRYDDIDPQDLDPRTGAPYRNYSSPSLDTSFHDGERELDFDDDDRRCDDCGRLDSDCGRKPCAAAIADEEDDEIEELSDDPRALQGMGH